MERTVRWWSALRGARRPQWGQGAFLGALRRWRCRMVGRASRWLSAAWGNGITVMGVYSCTTRFRLPVIAAVHPHLVQSRPAGSLETPGNRRAYVDPLVGIGEECRKSSWASTG